MSGDASPVRAGDSLLLGNAAQLLLVEVDEAGLPAAAYAEQEQRGRFTGERLFFANPKLYGAIAKLIARGLPYREIADICAVSINTVCGVAFREGATIETLRERIGRLGLDVAFLTMECIRELLADPAWRAAVSAKDLAIIHGIAFTNAQLALGGATSRIEEFPRPVVPLHEDYERALREMKNVTGTGSGAEAPALKGDTGSAPGANGAAPIDITAEPPPDPPAE